MKKITLILIALGIIADICQGQNIPQLRRNGGATQLIVNGKPFLMISGELHNSTSSSLSYLDPLWPDLKNLNLNSLIASVSWEQFEPHEGVYDFTLVDGIIQKARDHDLKLCLIWFATWKNGLSSYTPMWVKKDIKRFFRVQDRNGNNMDRISPSCKDAVLADAKAYAVLMKHIKEVDKDQTVIIMQVNNEVGIKQDLDYSKESLKLFKSEVPVKLIDYLNRNKNFLNIELKTVWALNGYETKGSWTEIFGDNPDAREFFTAWQYANYLNEICKQGRKEYNLPMFVNAALVHYKGELPGLYLNGGPVSRVMDIYKAAAPEIDICAPDIYLPAFKSTCAEYTRNDNPLFIPECTTDAGKAFYAFAEHDAICFAPFGIDGDIENRSFGLAYSVLNELSQNILQYQGTGMMHGFLRENEESGTELLTGKYILGIIYGKKEEPSYGLVIQTSEDEFIISGTNCRITVSAADKKKKGVIGQVWEGKYKDNNWIPLRLLNGDETSMNRALIVSGRKLIPFFIPEANKLLTPSQIAGQYGFENEGTSKISSPAIYKVTLYTHDL
jgi:beta-galactosidase GanA